MSAEPVALNTPHARAMLRIRYAAPEWSLMEEVAPKTGGGTRYADAIAVNLWSSRGHAVHGFEIKVSRGDWLRELKQPEKADELVSFCDHWWIVAPAGIVKSGELPPNWGLLELRAKGLVQVTAAPRLEAKPVTRAFFASLMRRGHESLQVQARALVHKELTEVRGQQAADYERCRKDARRDVEKLEAKIKKFEEETGLSFGSEWSGPPVAAVKLAQRLDVLQGYDGKPLGRLAHMASDLERLAANLRAAIPQPDETDHPEAS